MSWIWPSKSWWTATHPTSNELMRFADDGGRIPEKDRIPVIGGMLRIRLPTDYVIHRPFNDMRDLRLP
jgi:hypothetical protein